MKRVLSALVILMLFLGIFSNFSHLNKHEETIKIKTFTVNSKDLYNSVVAPGTVSGKGSKMILFPVETEIEKVFVSHGQKVRRGEKLFLRSSVRTESSIDLDEIYQKLLSQYSIPKSSFELIVTKETEVRSPINGIITEMNFRAGESVAPFEIIATITDYSTMEILAEIPEAYISDVKIGQSVVITGSAFSEREYMGTVVGISSMAHKKLSLTGNGEVYVPVTIALKNSSKEIKPGYSVQVKIRTQKSGNACVIPYDCIIQEDDKEMVYTVKDGIAYKKRIITGLELDQETEVVYGLVPGEMVIRNPQNEIKSGSKVESGDMNAS